jgi:hypothetical protein
MVSIVIDRRPTASIKAARAVAGSLGFPSKMPGTAYGLPAQACNVGGKLAQIEGSVCSKCYALKGNYLFDGVQASQSARLEAIKAPEWCDAMVTLLSTTHARGTGKNGAISSGWHRWHDSGDLQSFEHLAKICEVARRTPQLRHWLPTREAAIVKQYLASGAIVPDNLVIRVSAAMVDGAAPKAFAHTSGVHKTSTPANVCPASTQGNQCGNCRMCWDATVPHVSYPLH